MAKKFRIEKDSMGEVKVPADAYYGAQTQRAVNNFPVSGIKMPFEFIKALSIVKLAAAKVNMEFGFLDKKLAKAIIQAAEEIIEGKIKDQFPVDIFQTGSGTSTNMNINEVIATRANEILTGKRITKNPVHPNDHVNFGQSSNDVIPTAIHVSSFIEIKENLYPALKKLERILGKKEKEFDKVIKIGRTHLQDATPIRLGQEFSGYKTMIKHGIKRIKNTEEFLSELAIGGTAVGTGLNTHKNFGKNVAKEISKITGIKFKEAENHFEAQGTKDAIVELSGALKTVAVSLMKIANDIRWMGSGPRCGIGEILIPPVQPGSSIMPGKVNPVIAESVCQVAAQVIGNDATITIAGQSGNFELNVMMPLIAYNILYSIKILSNSCNIFVEKSLKDLKANEKKCKDCIEKSLAMITALVPKIGYDKAAEIAKEAYEKNKTIREILLEKKILSKKEIEQVLNPYKMTEGGLLS